MSLLCFCAAGKMQAGKDSSVAILKKLVEERGGEFFHFKLADPLYSILAFAQDEAGFPREKERFFLQWMGTEWGRAKDPDVWVKHLIRRIETFKANELNPDKLTVIAVSDGRFINEFEGLKEAGFYLIRVKRPLVQRLLSGATRIFHRSEKDVNKYSKWDADINNRSGSLVHLEGFIQLALEMAESNQLKSSPLVVQSAPVKTPLRNYLKAGWLFFKGTLLAR